MGNSRIIWYALQKIDEILANLSRTVQWSWMWACELNFNEIIWYSSGWGNFKTDTNPSTEEHFTCLGLGPPLKNVVSGPAAGWVYYCRMGTFIFILPFFFLQKCHTKKREKNGRNKILRPPDWPQFRPTAGQETNSFLRVAWVRPWIQTSLSLPVTTLYQPQVNGEGVSHLPRGVNPCPVRQLGGAD